MILLLAPRILPPDWFERAIIEFGQATGVAASGLLLLRMADPGDRSPALTAFSIKQLLLQPVLAGGVITVVAPLVVDSWGLPAWTGLCLALVLLWIGWACGWRRGPAGGRTSIGALSAPSRRKARSAHRRAERRAHLTIAATLPPSTVSTAPVVRSSRARATKASATSPARTSAPSRLPAM